MWAAIVTALVLSLAVPQTLSAQPTRAVRFVNETDRQVGLQVSGSEARVGGPRHIVLKPRGSAILPVVPGHQRLQFWAIQGAGATRSGATIEKGIVVQAGSMVRITEEDFRPAAGTHATGAGNLAYAGYSKQFVSVKQLFLREDPAEVRRVYRERDQKVRESCQGKLECYIVRSGFLGLAEKGTLSLDVGAFDESVEAFHGAEFFLTLADNESKTTEWLKKGLSAVLETLTGYEEFGLYYGEGFERVLMLNYKTMGYMLKGDRKAYNVTRRAIDWQNMERRRFEERLADVDKELREKAKGDTYSSQVREAYAATDAKASTVASAYVNPFGYYMAGVIQELEGQDDPSLVSNALISYRKALELNPRSPVIQDAIRQLEPDERTPPETKLVHVIVNDGFAPEKMVLTHYLDGGPCKGSARRVSVPVKMPYYQPVRNKVQRIAIESKDGAPLGDLSPVADVEAIVLRHQKDLQPFIIARIVLSTIRHTFGAALQCEGTLGQAVSKLVTGVSAPDTRAWMTLPSSVQAGRVHVPRDLEGIVIATYDGSGTRLASRSVALHETGATFVYGRSLDDKLVVHASQDLWVNGGPGSKAVVSQ